MIHTIHHLKTSPNYFSYVKNGDKNFEVRKNDRGFLIGDELLLKEFVPENYYSEGNEEYYTGQICHRKIIFILAGGQLGIEKGYVILGISVI